MPDFPQSAPVKKLQREHPDYSCYKEVWEQIGTLYEGGVKIREAVMRGGQFLVKNPKELPEVFSTRQARFSYTNLLGNIIGWYISALFKQPPQLVKKLEGGSGEAATELPQAIDDFCSAFEKNCNRAGMEFQQFCKDLAEKMLLYRCVYALVDLPAPDAGADPERPMSLQEQTDLGLLNPFLVLYTPGNVINWGRDAYGNLEWATIYVRAQDQDFLEDATVTDYWYHFTRTEVALYEREVKDGASTVAGNESGAEEVATLCPGYPRPHALADQNRLPLFEFALPDGLWLANRVFLPLINHINQDNALDFGLMQANLPQLVIEDGDTGSYEEPVMTSVVGFHKLPHGGKMYYLEPGGVAYDGSQKRIDNLEERIYKTCYLMDQARTNRSTPTAQSGLSKQQDKTPSRDALSGIGDVLRPRQQDLYAAVLHVAGFDQVVPDVRGYDFSDRATAEDMTLLEQATVVPVNSPKFERELGKKNVRCSLPDLNPETLQEIDDEIDKSATPSEQQAQEKEQQQQAMLSKFQSSLQSSASSQLPE